MMTFGDLRSMVQRPYSVRAWQDLCRALEQAMRVVDHQVIRQQWVPYALDHIQSWPQRLAPRSWIEMARTTQSVPALQLATEVHVGPVFEEQSWFWTFDDQRQIDDAISPMTEQYAERFLNCEDCRNLTTLYFDEQYLSEDALYRNLLHNPIWDNLTALYAYQGQSNTPASLAVVKQLKQWSTDYECEVVTTCTKKGWLEQLETLWWMNNDQRVDEQLTRQIEGGKWANLHTLNLYDNHHIYDGYLDRVLRALPKLHTLNLGGQEWHEGMWDLFCENPIFSQLQSLDLSWSQSVYASTFKQLPTLPHLKSLNLALTGFDADTFDVLFQSTKLPSLVSLDLSLISEEIGQPWEGEGLPNLQRLAMPRMYGGYNNVLRFLSGSRAKQLKALTFWSCDGNHPAEVTPLISRAELLPNLECLRFMECDFVEDNLIDMLKHLNYPNLHTLDLRNNWFDGRCVETLLAQPWCANLRHLDLRYNLLDKQEKEALWQAPQLAQCALFL